MNVQNIDRWNLLGYEKQASHTEMRMMSIYLQEKTEKVFRIA